jgi:hypothetical protein
MRKHRMALSAVLLAVAGLAVATPARAAAPVMNIWAVGDSYASGQGAMHPQYGWDSPSCYRSRLAGPQDAANQLSQWRPTTFMSLACSGATTAGVMSQLGGLPSGPIHALTMSVGGNDIGFASIVGACLGLPDCSVMDGDVDVSLFNLTPRLAALFAAVPQNVEHVFVTEYPDPTTSLFGLPCGNPLAPGFEGLEGISDVEATWASLRVVGRLNATVSAAVTAANNRPGAHPSFQFVTGVSARFAEHGYCNGFPSPNPVLWPNNRYINTPADSVAKQGDALGSMHPNDLGQREIAAALVDAMRYLTVGPILVPNLLYRDESSARAAILAAGLIPIKAVIPDPDCPEEQLVVEQVPGLGSRLWPGDSVVYKIAIPHPKYCR